MVTVLGVPGRFGELTITRSDVKALQATRCGCGTTGLDRVWDKIKDWFFNTKLVEAKLHLQVLYDPDALFTQRAESYFALKSLVGPAYLDRFSETTEDFGYSMNIQFGDGLNADQHAILHHCLEGPPVTRTWDNHSIRGERLACREPTEPVSRDGARYRRLQELASGKLHGESSSKY